jgi:large subunit ribosomal protein L27
MAHKKGAGSTDNGRDSASKRLGVKLFGSQHAIPGNIIVRQRGTKFHAGENVYMGVDHTLHARIEGTVVFTKGKGDRTFVHIIPFVSHPEVKETLDAAPKAKTSTRISTATPKVAAAPKAVAAAPKVVKVEAIAPVTKAAEVKAAPVVEVAKAPEVKAAPVVEVIKALEVKAAPVVEETKAPEVKAAPVVEVRKAVKVEAAPAATEEVKSSSTTTTTTTTSSSSTSSSSSSSSSTTAFNAGSSIGDLEDNLKIVEGIGPKIEQLIKDRGIKTWAQLSETPVETLQSILHDAGSRYTMHNPGTWPRQAKLAAEGKWEELEVLQKELDGGK